MIFDEKLPAANAWQGECFLLFIGGTGFAVFSCEFVLYRNIDGMEEHNISHEESNDAQRIDNGISANKVEENVVRCSVACHQEHIVVIKKMVSGICGNAEEAENSEGDGKIFALHAGKTCKSYVKRSESGDSVCDTGYHVVKRENRVATVVLTCADGAQNSSEDSENKYEIKSGFSYTTLRKRRERNGDELNTAEEEGKRVEPTHRVVVSDAEQHDLCDLKGVNGDRRDNKSLVFGFHIFIFKVMTEQYCQGYHCDHKTGHEEDMLPGQIAFGLAGVAAESYKLF